ncbi:hypothetical protein GGI25_002708 [Coemansia spiralis]|uniref:Uncharacterized protein n=2 Tax=Coemansia TaxID=4863 RepID=A0A9W8GA49_9FUNG|nr:hypothetical protein EDC05_002486 [Coemansia umbellata]KAJ2622789.1 hypothetical protein GGI26_002896 [Coemansia sp. RSA 1358]KAJ2678065.1 hypothetical protein GGI25_002708 [Coemansia spiralis]
MESSSYTLPGPDQLSQHAPEQPRKQLSPLLSNIPSKEHTDVGIPSTPRAQTASMQPSKSAPPKSHAQLLLTSPPAARRSKESLEAIKVARTLKEGLLRLKARADPQSPNSNTSLRRPMRTFSATAAATAGSTPYRPLSRHNSEFPRFGPLSNDGLQLRSPDRLLHRTQNASGLSQGLISPKSRPVPLHLTHSCPQRRSASIRTSADLFSPVPNASCSQHGQQSGLPAPRFVLDPPSESSDIASMHRLKLANSASTVSDITDPHNNDIQEGDPRTEVAEAAATMILFMKSEPSSQNDLSTSSLSPPPLNQSPSVSPPSSSIELKQELSPQNGIIGSLDVQPKRVLSDSEPENNSGLTHKRIHME